MRNVKSNRVGENALDRTSRLLERVNQSFADVGSDDLRFIDLRLERSGAGCLHYPSGEVFFQFDTLPQLTTFLEGSPQEQVRAVAGQRT